MKTANWDVSPHCSFRGSMVLSVPGQPTCSNGVVGYEGSNDNGIACCPLECTKCGGTGCGTVGAAAGLDSTACCVNGVLNNQELCSVAGEAPCEVDGGESCRCVCRGDFNPRSEQPKYVVHCSRPAMWLTTFCTFVHGGIVRVLQQCTW